MSNFRMFAWGWSLAGAAQLAFRAAGVALDVGLQSLGAGVVMATAWGFGAVAMFGDRKAK